jgi:glycine cleavage system H protein
MPYPAKFRYSQQHQWIDVEGDIGTVGLTDFAQSQLNEIVSVQLPKPGAMLEAGQPLGSVESVKAVNEIDAPVSGEVVEVNAALKAAPEKINSDPHGQGWLVKVRLKNPTETSALMDAAAYDAYATVPRKEAAANA